jgi:uncharacterized SAM-binding protein YcdF (DUF218 family)
MRRNLIWVAVFILSAIMVVLIVVFYSRPFFAYTNPVNSDLLILEAWISPFELEQAIPLMKSDSVKRIIIVGQKYPDDRDSILSKTEKLFQPSSLVEEEERGGVYLLTNSSLVFDLKSFTITSQPDDTLLIGIRARGSEAAGYCAHFNLIVNGQYAGGAFASEKDTLYTFAISIPREDMQSIVVHFGNDLVHQNHDRNLNIISLRMNETEIIANESNTLLIKHAGRYANGFLSQADEKKNYLVHLGVPPEKIKVQSFAPVRKNQTLASARTFASNSSINEISSVNIVSSGMHSRRTWLTYQRLLGKKIPVGVINFEQSDFRKGSREDKISQFVNLMEEALSYFINWVYLVLDIE